MRPPGLPRNINQVQRVPRLNEAKARQSTWYRTAQTPAYGPEVFPFISLTPPDSRASGRHAAKPAPQSRCRPVLKPKTASPARASRRQGWLASYIMLRDGPRAPPPQHSRAIAPRRRPSAGRRGGRSSAPGRSRSRPPRSRGGCRGCRSRCRRCRGLPPH